MAAQYHSIDLDRFALSPGEGRRVELGVRPGPLELGGQSYGVPGDEIPARLEISRTAGGYALRLTFGSTLAGPCMRCLADARLEIEVEAREVNQPGSGDEELLSPYVDGALLEIGSWAHDALALAMPAQILCRPDCAGLCPVCGESLNDADPAEHHHRAAKGPFAKLSELDLG
jgi:uncharacterized protein